MRAVLCNLSSKHQAMKQTFLISLSLILFFSQTNEQPDARASAHFIYSPKTNSLLLIDGYTNHPATGHNDVYSWNGKKWKKITASGPDTRSLSTGALNTKTGNIVVFGGVGKDGYENLYGDTWEFDGRQWHQINTNNIGTRDHGKMVYASGMNGFVMYGGQNTARDQDSSTWILRNREWKELKIPGPGGRYHFGMVYDPVRNKVVLYGGYNNRGLQRDTWEFDGTKWELITTKGPGPRGRFSMAYDESRKMSIFYGGDVWKKKVDTAISADGKLWDLRGDTWGWDGQQWKEISGGGPERMLAALGYDVSRKKLVLFGGEDAQQINYADTWEFQNNKWIKVADNGAWKWNGKEYEKVR